VTLNVAPYVVVEQELELDGIEDPLPFVWYVLPENAEKAALQSQDVPAMLRSFTRAFGPFPFPGSKFALVETPFWGMEHSTAIAYGSSYPAWIAAHGGRDRHAARNRLFDYILVHESAHEWWGNAVSARTWGDFWIHEGFATYAEAVYLEDVKGAELAQQHMDTWKRDVKPDSRLYRGDGVDSGEAYDITLYAKGAWVLHTLRQIVDDDDAFWRTLRAFNLEFRYGNASTQDFRAVLERETGADWKRFFDEWVYGKGFPSLRGSVKADGETITIRVTNEGSAGDPFHVPLDLAWKSDGPGLQRSRVWLEPGENRLTIPVGRSVSAIEIRGLERILCHAQITIEPR
jgi:aminopeptidase N